jgi:hypothetical protein
MGKPTTVGCLGKPAAEPAAEEPAEARGDDDRPALDKLGCGLVVRGPVQLLRPLPLRCIPDSTDAGCVGADVERAMLPPLPAGYSGGREGEAGSGSLLNNPPNQLLPPELVGIK